MICLGILTHAKALSQNVVRLFCMLLLELNKIKDIKTRITYLEQSAEDGLLSEAEVISAVNTAMKKIERLKRDYVDKIHDWNERDKKPRTKSRRGEKIEYYMTHVKCGKETKQLSASTLDALYEKLFDFYNINIEPGISSASTLRELFEIYIKNRERDAMEYNTISSQTANYDRTSWNRFFKDSAIADMKVAYITQREVIYEFKRITGNGKVTLKTFNKAKGLLDGIFDVALEAGIINNNPSRIISKRSLKFKQESNNDKVYTPEERNIIISHIKNKKQSVFTLAVRLAFCFPLRIGELTALTWKDYNEKNRTIHVWHQIIYESKNGKNRVATDVEHTKGNTADGERFLHVSNEGAEILEQLRQINGKKKYILTATRGINPISLNKFNEHLKEYCSEAGVRYLSSHKIRFYGATELFNAGVDPEQIRRVMGHTTLAMTEHYNRTNGKINIDEEIWNKIFDDPKKKPGEE